MSDTLPANHINLLNRFFGDELFAVWRTSVGFQPTDLCVKPKIGDYLASLAPAAGFNSFYSPEAPPQTIGPDDDEFDGTVLDSAWNLHTTGLSAHNITWTPATLSEGTVEMGHVYRYQLGAAGNPSALCIQPGSDGTDLGGISRKLISGVVPDDWTLTVGMSFGINRLNAVSPDMTAVIFMANEDLGNNKGDWDYEHYAAVLVAVDYSAMIVKGVYADGGGATPFGTGTQLTCNTGSAPIQFQLSKHGDIYRVSVRLANGQKILIMEQDLSATAIAPTYFGVAVSASATPNAIIPINYIRSRFDANDF